MKNVRLLATAACAALFGAPLWAQAQPTTAPQSEPAAPPAAHAAPVNPAAPAAADAASPVAASTRDETAPLGSSANPMPASSPTPVGQASTLVAGDPTVVSNGPVPDTKANRARYGQPLSATGRRTEPAGN